MTVIMLNIVEQLKAHLPYDCFSDTEVFNLIPGSDHRRYGLMKRAFAKEDLLSLRRGFYCLAEKHRRDPLNLFYVAQRIEGPSYVSFESALSYHGWIPEAVYTVTSASAKRSKQFKTPLGIFDYQHISCEPFLTGVQMIREGSVVYWMAEPWKALADYLFVHKENWKSLHPLIESLRIDKDCLYQNFDAKKLEEIEVAYHNKRISKFIRGIMKELL